MNLYPFLVALALVAATACGADNDDAFDAPPAGDGGGDGDGDRDGDGLPPCVSSNECPAGTTCSEFGECVAPGEGAPEDSPEVEFEFSSPLSSRRYVYVAMPELNALARIDGETLDVASVPVGQRPRVIAAVPNSDAVIALDQPNGTATLVRAIPGEPDRASTVRTLPHMNRLDVTDDGGYAVAWFDLQLAAEQAGGVGGIEDVGSFQDVTLLAVGDEGATLLSVDAAVGFGPRAVTFDSGGDRAFVVTDDGISIIDLADAFSSGPGVSSPLAVTEDPLSDPLGIEVAITPAGDYAVIREQGLNELRILTLQGDQTGALAVLPLPDTPTDVDLAPDGTRAYAVLRSAESIAVVDVPGDAGDGDGVEFIDIPNGAVGSFVLSDDGARALSFTNAALIELLAVVELDRPDFPVAVRRLQKSVRAVAFDSTATSALVIHAKAPGDPTEATTFEEFIDRSHGYSIVDIDSGFAKLQVTDVAPGPLSFAENGARAFLALDGSALGLPSSVHTIELDTAVVRQRALNSPPEAVGVLTDANAAFVSQRHPLGRISFIDLTTDAIRTVTGFDLNGRVID